MTSTSLLPRRLNLRLLLTFLAVASVLCLMTTIAVHAQTGKLVVNVRDPQGAAVGG